jgi:hypothetical protein
MIAYTVSQHINLLHSELLYMNYLQVKEVIGIDPKHKNLSTMLYYHSSIQK